MLKLNRNGFCAPSSNQLRFGQILDFVVTPFDINVRVSGFDRFERYLVFENDNQINAFQCGKHGGSVSLRVNGAFIAFTQHLHRSV